MRICLELQPYLKTKSGIGVYAYQISRYLEKCDDVSITPQIFNAMGKIDVGLIKLQSSIDECRLMSYSIYRRVWHYLPINYNIFFKKRGDIYHFFDYIVPPRIKGKVVTTIHDMTYELYPETMQKTTLKRIKGDIEYSVRRADKVVTISESTKKDIMRILKVPEEKIEIIPPGVEFEKFNKKYEEQYVQKVKQKYGLPNSYILYMGTLEPRKNIETIVEAFSLLKNRKESIGKNTNLVIAGKKGWLYDSIFNKVKNLNLEKDVIFTDYVKEEDKVIIYQLAEFFVFPSIYEGFGIPVIEAMAASIPVITSNTSSLPEVAGEAAILINPKDKLELANAMHQVLEDKDLAKQMIKKGLVNAQKFSWESSAHKLYELYRKMM